MRNKEITEGSKLDSKSKNRNTCSLKTTPTINELINAHLTTPIKIEREYVNEHEREMSPSASVPKSV